VAIPVSGIKTKQSTGIGEFLDIKLVRRTLLPSLPTPLLSSLYFSLSRSLKFLSVWLRSFLVSLSFDAKAERNL
jgi:hypothetical protein